MKNSHLSALYRTATLLLVLLTPGFGSLGLHASTMSGARVSSIGPGAGTAVTVAAFDPSDADIVYVGGDCQGVMRSLDGGQTWSAPNEGLLNPADPFYEAYFVLEIEVDPLAPATVYAGTQRGIYSSRNRGQTWQKLDISAATEAAGLGNHRPVGAIEVDPADNSIIYAGFGDNYTHDPETANGILLKSVDKGVTWSRIGLGILPADAIIYDLVLDPAGASDTRRLIVSTDKGIFKSEDGGANFSRFEEGLPHDRGRRLAVSHPASGLSVFYLVLFPKGGMNGGVYKWSVGTGGWTGAGGSGGASPLILYDLAPCIYNWIVVHPTNPDLIHLASAPSYVENGQCDTETLFRSTDGGATWDELWPEPASAWFKEVSIFAMLALAPSDPTRMIGGYVTMIASNDGGTNWEQIYADIQGMSPNRKFKARSTDIGSQMWALSAAIDPRPSHADTLFSGYADALLFKTDDLRWFHRLAALGVDDPIEDLADGWGVERDGNLTPQVTLDPADPQIVYASANYRLYRSSDGGQTWTELTGWTNPISDVESERDNAARFAIDPNSPADNRILYVTVFGSGVYKSNNGGQTWAQLNDRIGEAATQLSGVYIDPSDSSRIYLGTFSLMHYSVQDLGATFPLYYSADSGLTWQTRGGLPAVNRLWIDPENGQRVLAASMDLNATGNQGGVYLSSDGGLSWQRTLDQPVVTDIAADPHTVDRIWALSSAYYQYDTGIDTPDIDAGLYFSLDRGLTWQRLSLRLNHYMLYPLAVHPTRPNELFIGTAGLGLKRVTISGILAGDIDDDGVVGLGDAILTLKIIAKLESDPVFLDREIDNDGTVGLPEAIFALQMAAANPTQ